MDNNNRERLSLEAVRERLSRARGKEYWRSLEELAETQEFKDFLRDEFPQQTRPFELNIDRRQFLLLMGSSLALAGLAGCRVLPQEKIVPYVKAPEDLIPGVPLNYATVMPFAGDALGVLVASNTGRPIKIEGNDLHPSSLGSTDSFAQAAILSLYDPDRAQTVTNFGETSTWDQFLVSARTQLQKLAAARGAGLAILTETVTSPTLGGQLSALLRSMPAAKWHQWQPVNRDNVRAGAVAAFGRPMNTVYHFDRADIVVSLDADFLLSMPGHVRYARDFGSRRQVRTETPTMNRLYVAETTTSLTGANADHRIPVKPSELEPLARALATALGVAGAGGGAPAGGQAKWVADAVSDLQANRGRCVIVPGDEQPAAVHALAHAMNHALGNVGATVTYTDPIEAASVDHRASLADLVSDMKAGRVKMLVILGGNPAYGAPADLDFAGAMAAKDGSNNDIIPFRVHLAQAVNETTALCHWHVPETHFLEHWSDARSFDGTAAIVQPLIRPLYDGHSPHELIQAMVGDPREGVDIVHDSWAARMPGADFERRWNRALNDGVIAGAALPARTVAAPAAPPAPSPAAAGGIEVVFRPDPSTWDGSFANNGWMQELPKPLTKLTWDNAGLINPKTAHRLGIGEEDVVEVQVGGRKVNVPVLLQPGTPEETITLTLGYGRTTSGKIGTGVGYNAYLVRTSDMPWSAPGAQLRKTGDRYHLVTTRSHSGMEDRDPVRAATLAEFTEKPQHSESESEENEPTESLWKPPADHADFQGNQWGMSIDNTLCIGCNACVVACQAENNIPIIGKDEVDRGREMHWIRIDRYFESNAKQPDEALDNPVTHFQPVPCMHCEKAPCEPVCPVGATVHSHEGLNQQVYNRCVGTKYCSNNCPYKVRRFNFYKYTAGQPANAPGNYDIPVMKLLANPNVTVRGRGVMEKCSYCVQRINAARIGAKVEGRNIRDGEVVPACAQACPTRAITFGDVADKGTQVSKLKAQPHNYSLLGELNTRPRTTYLPSLHNPKSEG